MSNYKVPIRQTHLDFHTSPDIENIGGNFSKENFQAALKEGNLESITVFAKCHHSMCYYPTKIGTMHPHLKFDLTGAMVDAAHEIGVRAPIYITAGWSHKDAQEHPEWLHIKKDGTAQVMNGSFSNLNPDDAKQYCHWQALCLCDGNEYTKHIYEITKEVCERYSVVDGIFYDICSIGDSCYCDSCKKGMEAEGVNIDNDEEVKEYFVSKRQAFMQNCRDVIAKYHPDATVIFNGTINQYKKSYQDYNTHFEMEDLPTAWGGYDKLPMRAKYFAKKGDGLIGMTGKFHLDWGEFGGFKSKEALKFEVASMALYGAGASVGDHMHPDGEMEMETYRNIGYAYRYQEKIAPFCFGGKSVADLGIYASENGEANEGISNILLENQLDYDLVTNGNFADFDTVIVCPGVVMPDCDIEELKKYLANGGKLVVMADALVKDGKFQLDLGFEYLGKSEFDCDYLVSKVKNEKLPDAPMLCNIPGHRVAVDGGDVTAEFITPYFNRTYRHFCGHKNTPHNKGSKAYPAIVKKGNVVYVAHPLGNQYVVYGSLYHKRYMMEAINLVYGGGMLKVEGLGAQGRCTMIDQPQNNRYCINMVYASPVMRGKAVVIEDIMPIYNIKVTVKTDKSIKKVYDGLSGEAYSFDFKDGKCEFVLPKLECHSSIVLEY